MLSKKLYQILQLGSTCITSYGKNFLIAERLQIYFLQVVQYQTQKLRKALCTPALRDVKQ